MHSQLSNIYNFTEKPSKLKFSFVRRLEFFKAIYVSATFYRQQAYKNEKYYINEILNQAINREKKTYVKIDFYVSVYSEHLTT